MGDGSPDRYSPVHVPRVALCCCVSLDADSARRRGIIVFPGMGIGMCEPYGAYSRATECARSHKCSGCGDDRTDTLYLGARCHTGGLQPLDVSCAVCDSTCDEAGSGLV